MDASRLQRVLATNVIGPFLCAREAIKRMSTGRSWRHVERAAAKLSNGYEGSAMPACEDRFYSFSREGSGSLPRLRKTHQRSGATEELAAATLNSARERQQHRWAVQTGVDAGATPRWRSMSEPVGTGPEDLGRTSVGAYRLTDARRERGLDREKLTRLL